MRKEVKMQNNKFIEKVKDYLYGSNATGYENGEYTFHWDYDENVKEVEITDEKLAEELGESLPWVRGYVDFRKNDFKKGINIKFQKKQVFVPYEDFIEKRVKVWLDGYQTNYSRDGYFSDPLCENFKYWNFNFQPEVEKFQLI
tara:strand:- start:4657 stop:5085 length:429 start_codon:yes stop_codon:yes gene_type:complete